MHHPTTTKTITATPHRPPHAQFICNDCYRKKIGGRFNPTYTVYFKIYYIFDSGSMPLEYFTPPFYIQQHLLPKVLQTVEKFMKVIPKDEVEKNMKILATFEVAASGPASYRRYSQFQTLRQLLVYLFPMVVIPPLPEKSIVSTMSRTLQTTLSADDEGEHMRYIHEVQQQDIMRFLNALAQEPSVIFCYGVVDFLLAISETVPDDDQMVSLQHQRVVPRNNSEKREPHEKNEIENGCRRGFSTKASAPEMAYGMSFETLLLDYTNLLNTLTRAVTCPPPLAYINRLRDHIHGELINPTTTTTNIVSNPITETLSYGGAYLKNVFQGIIYGGSGSGSSSSTSSTNTTITDDDEAIRQVVADVLKESKQCDSMLSARHCKDALQKYNALQSSAIAYRNVVASLNRLQSSKDKLMSNSILSGYDEFTSTLLNADSIRAAHQQTPPSSATMTFHHDGCEMEQSTVDKMMMHVCQPLEYEAQQQKCLADTLDFYLALTAYQNIRGCYYNNNSRSGDTSPTNNCGGAEDGSSYRFYQEDADDAVSRDMCVISRELKKRLVSFEMRHAAALRSIADNMVTIGREVCLVQSQHIENAKQHQAVSAVSKEGEECDNSDAFFLRVPAPPESEDSASWDRRFPHPPAHTEYTSCTSFPRPSSSSSTE